MRTYGLNDLRRMKRLRRIEQKWPLTKAEARALCTAAAELVTPTKVPPLPTRDRFRQYWRAYHDFTKK